VPLPSSPPSPQRRRRRSSPPEPRPRRRSPPPPRFPPIRPLGKFPLPLLFLPMPSPSKMAHPSSFPALSGEPAVARRPRAIRAVRSVRTAQIKRGRTPLIQSTVDRWTGSTALVHRLRHACVIAYVMLASSRPTTARHVALP
jgi:hypothetical protein